MNQSQFLAMTCNPLEAREKSRVHGAIGFGFASHWLKNWRDSFKPITKCNNRNHVITFDSQLKTALCVKTANNWNNSYCASASWPYWTMTWLERFDLKPNEHSNKMEIASALEKY